MKPWLISLKTSLKIAIYSGVIPSSTFIEHLIAGVGSRYEVLLFGSVKRKVRYVHPHIRVIDTPTNQLRNVPLTLLRVLRLGITQPKLLRIAYKEARRYTSYYEQWMRFSRFVPVLLYRPDIFHIQWAGKLDRWVFLKNAYGCRLVLSLRGTQITISPKARPELAKMYVACFPEVSRFHAVCAHIKQEALQYGAAPQQIEIIYTLIQARTLQHFNLPKPLSKQAISVISVGRHHWVKGYMYAIQAIKCLRDQGIDATYTIVAPGLPPENLIFEVHQLGMASCVHFETTMDQEALFAYMKRFDVFLLSSLSEGIANVVLEAMAIGLPVVSTNCGGMSEVVISGETGWLVPVRNPQAMAEAVMAVAQTSEQDLERITQNAHNFVKAHFNAADVIHEFLELYEGVMRGEGLGMRDEGLGIREN